MKLMHTADTSSVCSLPPCGGGLGRGVAVIARDASTTTTPTPNPSPQGSRSDARLQRFCCNYNILCGAAFQGSYRRLHIGSKFFRQGHREIAIAFRRSELLQ